MGGPTEVRFENLADIHSGRHTERIQNDFHRGSVGQIRHVFFRKNTSDDAFVAVAAGHFISDRQLALHGDVHFDKLDHSRRQLVTATELRNSFFVDLAKDIDLACRHLLDFLNLVVWV